MKAFFYYFLQKEIQLWKQVALPLPPYVIGMDSHWKSIFLPPLWGVARQKSAKIAAIQKKIDMGSPLKSLFPPFFGGLRAEKVQK